jgi:prephenate dehydrogenase
VKVAVLGVGLIGGSVGLAVRERLGAEVVGWDPVSGISEAEMTDAVGAGAGSIADAVDGASAVFVATPVAVLPDVAQQALAAASDDCVVTDVGSTKRTIVERLDDERFIGGHPLAGAATAGVRNARADLFDGATWYLTPTARTRGTLYERLHRMLSSIGARPAAIDAAAHDRVLATVSHLPHVLANVLVEQALQGLGEERLPATGPSFRDITRVAGSNTAIWRDIYLSNADALMAAIDDAVERLGAFRELLEREDGDAIAAWNDRARGDRRRLLEGDLVRGAVTELRVSVPNRPGVVAEVALALGRGNVNIHDMALYPAPDRSSGYIVLWVAGDGRDAEALLAPLDLPVARG